MCVIPSRVLWGGYTPVCCACGVVENYDISSEEYRELKSYWDNWECSTCDPNSKGTREKKDGATKELRPYQSRALNELRQAVRDGYRKILLVAPTGSGKSVIFSKIISSATKKNNPSLFLVHKRELVYQASDHLDNESVNHSIIMAGEPMNRMSQVQVASTMTLWTRAKRLERMDLPPAKLLIVDEAHRTGSKTYNDILDDYPDSILIGVTATPIRKNGRGLGKQFEKMIVVATIAELQELGFLCETEYMVPAIPDLSMVDERGGDWVEEQLEMVMNDSGLVGSIVNHYVRFAKGRKTVLFASGVKHSIHLRDKFRMKGIAAEHVDADTSTEERMDIHDRLERGDVEIICNYGIYVEGIDMPDINCVIDARPSKSLMYHLQSKGRGLRPKSDGGKCLIIDHTGNTLRLGPVEMEHHWSLDETEKIYERDAKDKDEENVEKKKTEFICGHCGTIFESAARCPTCLEPIEKVGKSLKEAEGELTLYKPKKVNKKDKEPTKEEKQEWYSMFLWQAASKGYNEGWASHKYKDKFGVWPRNLNSSMKKPTQEFNRYMQYLRIKYVKQKEKEKCKSHTTTT